MNSLPFERKASILQSLTEGNSISSTGRIVNLTNVTVLKLLASAGANPERTLNERLVNLQCRYIQVGEIWNFVAKNQSRCTDEEMG